MVVNDNQSVLEEITVYPNWNGSPGMLQEVVTGYYEIPAEKIYALYEKAMVLETPSMFHANAPTYMGILGGIMLGLAIGFFFGRHHAK